MKKIDINKIKDFHDDLINNESLLHSETKEALNKLFLMFEKNQIQQNEVLLMFKAQLKLNERIEEKIERLKK